VPDPAGSIEGASVFSHLIVFLSKNIKEKINSREYKKVNNLY
jgi:hypothetical protein